MSPDPSGRGDEPDSEDQAPRISMDAHLQIEVITYDQEWPGRFAEEAGRIRAVLGSAALRIEHVGSTSVPGLAAKPIIDIILVVRDSADEASYLPAMQAAGYRLVIREPEWFEHRLLKGPTIDVNIHVFSTGAPEIDRMVFFRDWLRGNDPDRQRYADVKQELAKRSWPSMDHYADAKTAVVQEITERGRRAPAPGQEFTS